MSVFVATAAADLFAARQQMALSLGWHIVLASLGVGFPAIVLVAEWRGLRTGDGAYLELARRWAKALAVVFAVGAVSGTILSFEFGILWPGLMGRFGAVFGLPFAMEGFAFFIEAVFIGIYLYGWDRLSPRVHLWSGVPVVLGGVASAAFVVSANAWMNQPRGFSVVNGRVANVDPVRAMLNPAMPVEVTHMLLAAFVVSGFLVAAVHARGLRRGRHDRLSRLAFLVPFTVAAVAIGPQIAVGDWAARFVARYQPVKLAAMEGLYRGGAHVPLHLGGIPVGDRLRFAVLVPDGLSLLAKGSPGARFPGLDGVPRSDRPPVAVVHSSFDTMVAIALGLFGLACWFGWSWWRRRALPRSRWFLRAALVAGPAACLALEAGWVTTEVGRQPWIVYDVMRTSAAVTRAHGVRYGYYGLWVVYAALTVATVVVLRRLHAGQGGQGTEVAERA